MNFRLKSDQICRKKAFCRQTVPQSSSARKETFDKDNLTTSRNSDRKIKQPIRVTSRLPKRISGGGGGGAKQVLQMNRFQSSTFRKHFRWLREVANVRPTALHTRFCFREFLYLCVKGEQCSGLKLHLESLGSQFKSHFEKKNKTNRKQKQTKLKQRLRALTQT